MRLHLWWQGKHHRDCVARDTLTYAGVEYFHDLKPRGIRGPDTGGEHALERLWPGTFWFRPAVRCLVVMADDSSVRDVTFRNIDIIELNLLGHHVEK